MDLLSGRRSGPEAQPASELPAERPEAQPGSELPAERPEAQPGSELPAERPDQLDLPWRPSPLPATTRCQA